MLREFPLRKICCSLNPMSNTSHAPHRMKQRPSHTPTGRSGDMIEVTVAVPRDRAGALKHYAKRLSRSQPARRDEVLYTLRTHADQIRERFGVLSLSLFGSVVRDEGRRESDVDLLVEFVPGRPEGMFEFVSLKQWLEGLLSRPVDLVTPANIKPRIRPRIMKEAVRVL